MKNKPTRHKENNTIKFKPFSERVNSIDIDIFHKVSHKNEEFSADSQETYFYQCLQKWNFMNLSESYCNLKKELKDIVTLPQLLNKKDHVIKTLIKYLKLKNSLSLQSVLELVVAVGRDLQNRLIGDLQEELNPYFSNILSAIIDLLNTKDSEQLEYTFTALAYLFKFLWRYLIKKVNVVFDLLLPLLDDSKPFYIQKFAAESFAFVVRKLKDKESFLKLVINSLENKENRIQGCGKLLFEVISGIQGHFHSCINSMLPLYIDALQNPNINQEILVKVLSQIFKCISYAIPPQNIDLFWNIIFNSFNKIDSLSGNHCHIIVNLLKLIQIIINHKEGILLKNFAKNGTWTKKLEDLINKYHDTEQVLQEVLKISVQTILSKSVELNQEITSALLRKILSVENRELLLEVSENLITHSSFETLVLNQILKNPLFAEFDHKLLKLLTKIIEIKSPPVLGGINFDQWKIYNLNMQNTNICEYFDRVFLNSAQKCLFTEEIMKILVILPHVPLVNKNMIPKIKNFIANIYRLESYNFCKEEKQKINFTFLLSIECFAHITEANDFYDFFHNTLVKIKNPLESAILHEDDVSFFNSLDICLIQIKRSDSSQSYINKEFFDSLTKSLVTKIGSPNPLIRLTMAHIISHFSDLTELYRDNENNLLIKKALELPFLSECEEVSVHKYRDRLLHIQALDFQGPSVTNLNSKYHEICLEYLFGNLYINFSLLWGPVSQIIGTYANQECSQFWPTFLSKLRSGNSAGITFSAPKFDCKILSTLANQLYTIEEKIDPGNYHLLTWKCMSHFPNFCEKRSRDYIDLFIDFVEKNFFKSNSEIAKSHNIKKRNAENNELQIEETSEDEDEDNVENNKDEKTNSTNLVFGNINKNKLLLTMLEVFAKFTNVRSLYREPEIQKIYLDLLSSKNLNVQKAALNCIYTYKYDYISPYKEYLNNIIDEKNLNNELTRFQLSEENKVVQDGHRENLLKILMRILHSKMVMRVGMRTGGKTGGTVRRKCILRFLAGVHEDEMIIFIKMAFKSFSNYLTILSEHQNTKLEKMVTEIIHNVNLESVTPPKRLQSAVNLLAIIIEQFGGKMVNKLLPQMLGLLICILAEIVGILNRSDEILSGFLNSIKLIRNNCINIIVRFFAHFENYNWTSVEINALYNVAIFPWLEKLPGDGIHSPTPLLKIFISWSHNPRYYPLFIKYKTDDSSLTPLPFIMKLLLGPKTHRSVVNGILEIIEKLLTLQDFEKESPDQMEVDDKPTSLIPIVTHKLPLESSKIISKEINYGSMILLPHVKSILEYIQKRLSKKKAKATKTELIILSRISEFVTDSKICDTLLTLVIPILTKKASESEETIIQYLTTIANLVQHVEKPEIHLRSVLNLLGSISSAPARKLLIQLLGFILRSKSIKNSDTMIKSYDILVNLNAYDQRWIDQPDFNKRLDSFGKIEKLIEENELILDIGVAIIFNCFFFLKTESDLAMRDRSGQCLRNVGLYLAKKINVNSFDRVFLIDETILTLVRQGIRSKNENFYLQSIAFLGHIAMECPEIHPVLRDLHLLTNKQDPEVDFFENMQHLQLHRKARALLKFCSIAKSLKKPPNPKTMTQFILPLATSYLCNEKFLNKNSIIDAAIETIGICCKLLPWNQYEIILKYYLDKLRFCVEYQRQLIRIVVVILDGFHFDLSRYKVDDEKLNENQGLVEASKEIVNEINEEEKEIEIKEEEITDEKLDEALDDQENESLQEDKGEVKIEEDTPAIEKQTVLTKYMATRLIQSVSKGLLPQLHRSIAMRTRHEINHKVNKKKINTDQEEEELMRVPIALALVKLLQKMPNNLLDANLRGIFMKLCTFLKSRLESVRRTTREILQKIMVTLGPSYLHHLLKEMNALLTKGYQVHVLAFTIHAVLVSLKPYFKPEHIRDNLKSILSVCKIDLFGPSADEKDIVGIVKNVSEARSTKSYDIFHILAEFIDDSAITDTIKPLKDVLTRTNSHKVLRKIVECLRNFALGLADNQFIQLKPLLAFLFNVTTENKSELATGKEKDNAKKDIYSYKKITKPDCYIIPPEPKNKMGIKTCSKTAKNTNVHILVEFGFRLFHILLKRDRLNDPKIKSEIDLFVPALADCLKSQYVKICTLALQCLSWVIKMDLPNVRNSVKDICKSMFDILHKYAVAGLGKGDNYDLVMAAFKTMSVLVRDVKHFTITEDQLKVLLIYAEQDLHDGDKQATAFGLLKAIINRKLITPEIHLVMDRVANLSVTSDLDNVRKQARVVFYNYLFQYPIGKHVEKHLSFYLNQLSYELQPGRLSALELIYNVVTSFPLEVLNEHCGLIYFMVGVRLVNDEDPTCKKLCAKCIRDMIERLEHNEKKKLFDMVVVWLEDKKVVHRRLAAQLCGIFVSVEKENFESRLPEILPLLIKQFYADSSLSENEPGRFVKLQQEKTDDAVKDPERLKDHHLYQVLQLLLKIAANCTLFLGNKKYQELVHNFADQSQSLLAHPHLWVRLAASQFIGFVLAALNVEKVKNLIENPETSDPDDGYIYSNPVETLKSLVLDSVAQLQPDIELEDLFDQVIKNLVFIARLLKIEVHKNENAQDYLENTMNNQISLLWLIRKLRKSINFETTHATQSTCVRTAIFKWMAGVVATIPIELLRPILYHFMSPLVREMSTTEESNAPLRQLAKEVANMIKKKIGVEEYATLLSQAQQKLDCRRAERKKNLAQQFVTDPELAAKRKIIKQQKKKVQRKRKMEEMKGKKKFKSKKARKEINLEEN